MQINVLKKFKAYNVQTLLSVINDNKYLIGIQISKIIHFSYILQYGKTINITYVIEVISCEFQNNTF